MLPKMDSYIISVFSKMILPRRFGFIFKSGCSLNTSQLFTRGFAQNQYLYDTVVVGGGIVGLATAREIQLRYPKMKIAVVEKENELSLHQSKNNSGVIHAGIYYAPGSLKAKLCVEGLTKSYQYLEANKIFHKKCGKLIVAVDQSEVSRLDDLFQRAIHNKVPNVRLVDADEIKQIEPNCVGLKAIYSPETGIVDWRDVAVSYGNNLLSLGGTIYTGYKVKSFTEAEDNLEYPVIIENDLTSSIPRIQCKYVITCAGLQSDRVAKMSGCSEDPKIVPFRGDYLKVKPEKCDIVRGNIYPVPDPRFPFLGVHFTPRVDGSIWLGPNAILSLDREGYGRFDFRFGDALDALRYPGLQKIAFKYFGFGMTEIWNNMFIKNQVRLLQRFVPSLKPEDVVRGPSGIRAQAMDRSGALVDDFVIDSCEGSFGKHVMHVRNAPSPASTASLAIGRVLADKAKEQFELPEGETRTFV